MSDNTLESLGYTQELSRTLKLRDLVIYGLIVGGHFAFGLSPFS